MEADRRYMTPGSEKKDFITQVSDEPHVVISSLPQFQ